MKKLMIGLVKIGVAFLTVSIVLDFFLTSYQVLLWPALAFEFVLFSVMILSSLHGILPPKAIKLRESRPQTETDLTRLENLCSTAINQANPTAEDLISDRVRSLAFASAASNFNTPESTLRSLAKKEPILLQTIIKDSEITQALTTKDSLIQKGRAEELERLLTKIEEWIR